jgi:hypothetical protein
MTLEVAINRAIVLAAENNMVYMVLSHRNQFVKFTVYYVYEYDGRDVYTALVYADGAVLHANGSSEYR